MKQVNIVLFAILAWAFTGCKSTPKKEDNSTVAINMEHIDTNAHPCIDFYQYAIGKWRENNPVPETESRWTSFNILAEKNRKKLLTILSEVAGKNDAEKGSNTQLIRDLYLSGMDTTAQGLERMASLQPILDRIAAAQSLEELNALLPELMKRGIGRYFSFSVGRDSKNSEQYVLYAGQTGLTLPDRDYYLSKDQKFAAIRESYVSHVNSVFEMAGFSPTQQGQTILNYETKVAEICWPRKKMRNRDLTYNKFGINSWDQELATLPVREWLTSVGLEADSLVVRQPDFFKSLDQLLAKEELRTLKIYLTWKTLDSYGAHLNNAFERANFAFYKTTLRGIEKMKPKKERVLAIVNGGLGEALGQLFVEKHFSEESKIYVSQMIENLREAYRDRIKGLTWMSEETKVKALKKLDAFTYKVGYPDKWEDYSSLDIKPDQLIRNLMNIREFHFNDMVEKLGQPVDKDEWYMTPQTVNAYYSSSGNEIVFPAGILQSPFYHPKYDDAVNYGGIGAVIGHEFTHGFDDQGSKTDWNGNLNNWWTSEDSTRFKGLTERLATQYSAYNAIDSLHVDGELTLGENIADLGGLTLAYEALKKSYGNTTPDPIDGFTWQQRFFLGWANVWKGNIRDKELRNRLVTDNHSPSNFRVLGPLANLKTFEEAFGCGDSTTFVRRDSEKIIIW